MKRNVFPLQKLLFEKRKQPGARNPEGAVPILGLCHGVFTDQFICRHILGHFFFTFFFIIIIARGTCLDRTARRKHELALYVYIWLVVVVTSPIVASSCIKVSKQHNFHWVQRPTCSFTLCERVCLNSGIRNK